MKLRAGEVGLVVAGLKRKFCHAAAATVDAPCTLRRLAGRLLAMGQRQRPTDAMVQLFQQQMDQQLQQQRQQAELFTLRPEQQPALQPFLYQQREELMQQQQYQTQQLQQLLQRQAGGDA